MDKNDRRPVLGIFTRVGCGWCTLFEKQQLHKLVNMLGENVRCVRFHWTSQSEPPPNCVRKYCGWFPSIVLFSPESYYKYFTVSGRDAPNAPRDGSIEGIKYSAIENEVGAPKPYTFMNRPHTAEAVYAWVVSNLSNALKLEV